MGPAWLDGFFAHPKPNSLVSFHTTFSKRDFKKKLRLNEATSFPVLFFRSTGKALSTRLTPTVDLFVCFCFVCFCFVLFLREIKMASLNNPFWFSRKNSQEWFALSNRLFSRQLVKTAILRGIFQAKKNKPQLPISEGLSNVQVFGHVCLIKLPDVSPFLTNFCRKYC